MFSRKKKKPDAEMNAPVDLQSADVVLGDALSGGVEAAAVLPAGDPVATTDLWPAPQRVHAPTDDVSATAAPDAGTDLSAAGHAVTPGFPPPPWARTAPSAPGETGGPAEPATLQPAQTRPSPEAAVPGADTDAGDQAGGAPKPLFYRRLAPLGRDRHGGLKIARSQPVTFAAGAALVPLNVAEFVAAARTYPIVFAGNGQVALAVLGMAETGNRFIEADGRWRAGAYVPAYVRRYPFLLSATGEDKFVLCIDEAAPAFGDEGDPLFEDGEPSDVTRNALRFCQSFQREMGVTARFVAALEGAGLLAGDAPQFRRPDGRKLTVKGVRAIDPDRFAALPDETFLAWRREDWLEPAYAHMASMGNWSLISD